MAVLAELGAWRLGRGHRPLAVGEEVAGVFELAKRPNPRPVDAAVTAKAPVVEVVLFGDVEAESPAAAWVWPSAAVPGSWSRGLRHGS